MKEFNVHNSFSSILNHIKFAARTLIQTRKFSVTNLWLDDERPAPEGWHRVSTAPEAIWILRFWGPVNCLSLDHDLGSDGQGTGYDVACWLEEQVYTNPDFYPPRDMRVHSANPAGRANIQRAFDSIVRGMQKRVDY